jgi:hypothetical protein
LTTADRQSRQSSGRQSSGHSTLSRRARIDLATIVAAGAASTAFFLLPLWASVDRSSAPLDADRVQRAAVTPAIDPALATIRVARPAETRRSSPPPQRRAAVRPARAPRSAPAFRRAETDATQPQSTLARLFLGDGSQPVRPFPRPAGRSER